MKTRNTFTKSLALVALAAGLAVVIAAWQARQVQAIQDSEDKPPVFGLLTLAPGQTARLNVVAIGDPDIRPGEPRRERRVRLAFDIYGIQDEEYLPDPTGSVAPGAVSGVAYLSFIRRESRDVTLRPGQAASFDFAAAEGARVEASVAFLGGPDTRPGDNRRTPEPHLAVALEVLEGARTVFVVPAAAKGFNPQPDPPGQQQ